MKRIIVVDITSEIELVPNTSCHSSSSINSLSEIIIPCMYRKRITKQSNMTVVILYTVMMIMIMMIMMIMMMIMIICIKTRELSC